MDENKLKDLLHRLNDIANNYMMSTKSYRRFYIEEEREANNFFILRICYEQKVEINVFQKHIIVERNCLLHNGYKDNAYSQIYDDFLIYLCLSETSINHTLNFYSVSHLLQKGLNNG